MIHSLDKKQQVILFIHLTLGQMLVYPKVFPFFIKLFRMESYLSDININLVFSVFILVSSIYLAKDLFSASWKTFKSNLLSNIALAFKLLPLLYIASLVFNSLAIAISHQDTAANQALLNELYATYPFFIFITATIYAPIMEELLFRGFFFSLFEKKSLILAILISGLTFGFAHMYTADMTLMDFAFLPSYSVLGMIIAYSYHKSQTIMTPILLHFLNNFIGILLMSLM